MSDQDVADARAYADAEYPESLLAPENEGFAEIAERAFLAGRSSRTPTDDEREALSEASRRLSEGLDPDLRDGWTVLPDELLEDFRSVMAATRRWKDKRFVPDWDMDAVARRVKAREDAMLHRSEVPEPSAAREFLKAALAESDADEAEGGAGWDVEVDARTVLGLLDEVPEPSEPMVPLSDLEAAWRVGAGHMSRADVAEKALAALTEPQGDPSDAQVRAAVNAWHRTEGTGREDWYDNPINRERMRAALRAAGGAR